MRHAGEQPAFSSFRDPGPYAARTRTTTRSSRTPEHDVDGNVCAMMNKTAMMKATTSSGNHAEHPPHDGARQHAEGADRLGRQPIELRVNETMQTATATPATAPATFFSHHARETAPIPPTSSTWITC